jgi:uncharacterized protein YcfJ
MQSAIKMVLLKGKVMNKLPLFSLALLVANASNVALAGQDTGEQYYDQAKVLAVTPQFERINSPRQECHTEYVSETTGGERSSIAGSIIGGVAGGLLGSTIGRGSGKIAAAAVGAGVGAVVGDRMDNQTSQTTERPVQRCVLVDNWQTVERGYLVSYSYNGRNFSTVTNQRPTDTIRVRIAIAPVASDVVSYNQNPIPANYDSTLPQIGYPPPPRP